jgi:hypothetical protein
MIVCVFFPNTVSYQMMLGAKTSCRCINISGIFVATSSIPVWFSRTNRDGFISYVLCSFC